MSVSDRLQEIAISIKAGGEDRQVLVRTFLAWFGAQRRGYWIVKSVRDALAEARLVTVPDFETAYIDSNIALRREPVEPTENMTSDDFSADPNSDADSADLRDTVNSATPSEVASAEHVAWVYEDPTQSISKLSAANRAPVTVGPNSTLAEAVTLMMNHDFSQLPVQVSRYAAASRSYFTLSPLSN